MRNLTQRRGVEIELLKRQICRRMVPLKKYSRGVTILEIFKVVYNIRGRLDLGIPNLVVSRATIEWLWQNVGSLKFLVQILN